jgi:hypothetical protein
VSISSGERSLRIRTFAFSVFIALTLLFIGCRGELLEEMGKEQRLLRLFLEVVDGDTVIYRRIPMRFLGVDTPELRNRDLGFFWDQPFGRDAKEYTRIEIRNAKRVTYIACGKDRYGRTLVHLFVDGYPLSLKIVEAGLGYETVSFYGDNGFPEIADRIMKASKLHPDLPFENPYLWRQKNKRR